MNEIFEKIYNENNTKTEENILFEKVYTEAKMLNEMNPKLRRVLGSAALAAALGLGTVGCSTPNDDYSEPPAIEQPAPENPGETETETETPEDTGFEDSEETETPETPNDPEFGDPEFGDPEEPEPEVPETPEVEEPEPENPEGPVDSGETETETETETPNVVTFETLGVTDFAENLANAVKKGTKSQLNDIVGYIDLIYKDGFIPVEFNEYNTYEDGQTYIRYIDSSDKIVFYVPESMEYDFDTAIAAYKAAYAE